jgi:hypothetical protein
MRGGGVRNSGAGLLVGMGGVLSLRDVVIENNEWVGIVLDSGEADLEGCVVRGNGTGHATGAGGIRGRTAPAWNCRTPRSKATTAKASRCAIAPWS